VRSESLAYFAAKAPTAEVTPIDQNSPLLRVRLDRIPIQGKNHVYIQAIAAVGRARGGVAPSSKETSCETWKVLQSGATAFPAKEPLSVPDCVESCYAVV
jgi:hypothetical protein